MSSKKEKAGCGCTSIPLSVIVMLLGVGYFGFTQVNKLNLSKLLPPSIAQYLPTPQPSASPTVTPTPRVPIARTPQPFSGAIATPTPTLSPAPVAAPSPVSSPPAAAPTSWEAKEIRGIYLSRYQVTNNADEQTIRQRVRYYRQQGFNTIIHGVWGNGCTMYNSNVMQQTFGQKSCPNQFQDQWLNWLIDEAHKQGMQVHAYFEKGIKLDENSPIFNLAVEKRWIVPGVDKTYAGIDHYVLDVEIPEIASFFQKVAVEFVQKYPKIDAVQWDDYLGYHAGLPGKVDRTARLTEFVRKLRSDLKKANPAVSFDLCHHNPYWGKTQFAADWQNWNVDRAFIQAYNDANFAPEVEYAQQYAGVAITDNQLNRLPELVKNPKIKSILVFPSSGKPEETAVKVKQAAKSL